MLYKVTIDGTVIHDTTNPDLVGFDFELTRETNFAGAVICSVAINHPHYGKIIPNAMIRVYINNVLKFTGELTNEEIDMYGTKSFEALGVLSKLGQTVQGYAPNTNYTVTGFIDTLLAAHNSQIDEKWRLKRGIVTVTDPNDNVYRGLSYNYTNEAFSSKLIDQLGGSLRVREESDGFYLDYLEDYNRLNSQVLRVTENVMSVFQDVEYSDVYTAVLALGAKLGDDTQERLTIASVNGGNPILEDSVASAKFGKRVFKVVYDDVTLASNLLNRAQADLDANKVLMNSFRINAFDLSKVDVNYMQINEGDTIKVESPVHGFSDYVIVEKVVDKGNNPAQSYIECGKVVAKLTNNVSDADVVINEIKNNYVTNTELTETNVKIEKNTSAINQTASEIQTVVTKQTEQGKALEIAQSEIKQNADSISLTAKNSVTKGSVSLELSGETGDVTFTGNRLIVDSTNFKLDGSGSATFKGNIDTLQDVTVGNNINMGTSVNETKRIEFAPDAYIEVDNRGGFIDKFMKLRGGANAELLAAHTATDSQSSTMCGADGVNTISSMTSRFGSWNGSLGTAVFLDTGGSPTSARSNLSARSPSNYSNFEVTPTSVVSTRSITVTSDERLKTGIEDIDTSWVYDLKVRKYLYKQDVRTKAEAFPYIGLIAQDVVGTGAEKYLLETEEMHDADGNSLGEFYSIDYQAVAIAALKELQKLEKRVKALENNE